MVTLSLSTGSTTANTAIGIANYTSTNNKLKVKSNNIVVPTPGVYEIVGNITVTSSSGASTGVSVNVNGSTSGNSSSFLAAAASEVQTLPINTTFEVVESIQSGYVEIEFMPIGAPTITGSTIIVKQIV